MIIHSKEKGFLCYVCDKWIRYAIFDETVLSMVCIECEPFCIHAGRRLVEAGMIPTSEESESQK